LNLLDLYGEYGAFGSYEVTTPSMVDGMLGESLKQSLAMSKFLFSGRRQPTHTCCRSAMILRFPKPDSRDVLHMTHSCP